MTEQKGKKLFIRWLKARPENKEGQIHRSYLSTDRVIMKLKLFSVIRWWMYLFSDRTKKKNPTGYMDAVSILSFYDQHDSGHPYNVAKKLFNPVVLCLNFFQQCSPTRFTPVYNIIISPITGERMLPYSFEIFGIEFLAVETTHDNTVNYNGVEKLLHISYYYYYYNAEYSKKQQHIYGWKTTRDKISTVLYSHAHYFFSPD